MARLRQNDAGSMYVPPKQKKASEAKFGLFSEFGPGWIEITLPVRTVSEVNFSEHWSKKHKRHKIQQKTVNIALDPVKSHISLPCRIVLTRYAPRKLDRHDNLPISMKYIVDAVCAIITGDYRAGRADDDERIAISYDQVHSSVYGVKIRIEY